MNPEKTEEFQTDLALARRLGLGDAGRKKIGKLISWGILRVAGESYRSRKFLSKDLDAIRDNALAELAKRSARFTAQERASLAADLSPAHVQLRAGNAERTRLRANAIDPVAGVIRGAIVAEAGVRALGHSAFEGPGGSISASPGSSSRKLEIHTDREFLDSILEQVQSAGGTLRVRSDHNDAISARAGTADNFRIADNGQALLCDLNLNASYRDRATVIETATKNPQLIGLSIDFVPSFERQGNRALFRCEEIFAVDIVDFGAVTPSGLLPRS